MNSKIEKIVEYAKIIKDTPYALKTYLQTYDNTQKKFVPLDLFPDQIQLIKDYETYNENITRKYRQAGVTTVTAAWISKRLQTAKPDNPDRVLIIANKRDTAIEMANKIRAFLDQWPEWINVGFSPDKNSESRFRLNNGCEVKAVATSADALRGYTPTILIFDEAAYIEAGDDFWAASMASLSCVHEDSYILTDIGLIQLKDIVTEKERIGFTEYNGNLNVINHNLKITNIKSTFKSEKSLCYKITTKSGFELIGSYKHPLLVDKKNEDEWVWMENLLIGDKIKIQYNQNLYGLDKEITFDLKHGNEKEKYVLPSKLNEDLDLPYLIGLYIAKGSFSKNTIQICNGDNKIEEFLLKFGFIKNRDNHFYYTSSYLQRFFFDYIGIKKGIAKEKEIPNYILQSSKEVIKYFLQGLFDGDGCSFKSGVKYSSTSKKLVNQLQLILSNFGIKTYIRYNENKTSKTSIISNKEHITKIYELFIRNEDILKFYDEIGFRLTRKQNNKRYFIKKMKNKSFIYATKEELKDILKENNITRTEYEIKYRFLDGLMRKNKNHISFHSFEKLVSVNLKNQKTLSKWIERYENYKNFYYDEIVNIESFEDYTYDLEVPDGHSFISNSIISHNTGGKIILISTPNGYDPIYYGVYDQAIRGLNDFHITDLRWFKDPRYTKDLRWVKCNDIVHYMLNREQYDDNDVVMSDFEIEKYQEYEEQGYKPFSSWFESMSKKFKYDRRKIAQELECDFLGSGDGVIPNDIQENIAKNLIRVPTEKYMQGTLWQWKEPINGHRYILGCLPPYEKVLTNSGLKNIIDITKDDKLINENGNEVNIINKQIYNVENENIYEITVDNTYRTTTFTKEHPILISKSKIIRNYKKNNSDFLFNERHWDFDFKYIRAEDIEIGDWIKTPNIYKKELVIDYDEKWNLNSTDVRYDFVINSPLNDDDFWWFIGAWLGDGWLQSYKYSNSIHICFNKLESYYLNKTIRIIEKLFNRKPTIIEKDTSYEIIFNCKQLHNFINNNFGQYSYGKKINEWVKYIDKNKKLNLLQGYFDSDGCWIKTTKKGQTNSKISYVSINLELLESIQDILFSLGIISSLNKLRKSGQRYIRNKLSLIKDCYNLTLAHYDSLNLIDLFIDKNDIKLLKHNKEDFIIKNKRIISSCHLSKDEKWIYFRVKKIKKSSYFGDVYNFECDTNTFMCHHITTHNCDVSRGDSEDFSSMNIIDFDDREQVVEYIGKIPPDDLASIAYKWGILYGNAFIAIDITGGMGVATSRKLVEMGYKNLFIDGINVQNIWEYKKSALDKIPGINFNNKRTQIVASFEEQVRKGFAIRSNRLLNELNTFVYINGRPDHMKGAHDDSIMSLSIALYVGDISFSQLEKVDNANKAMLESWVMSERTYESNKTFYSYGTSLDPLGSMQISDGNLYYENNPMNHPMEVYKEFSWLFGNPK